MTSSLVGSEMCIRDRHDAANCHWRGHAHARRPMARPITYGLERTRDLVCLLYTSDAADDM
eukprot:8774723-Prorocentrum_lima.AAC.1